jgi:hypothetical protein
MVTEGSDLHEFLELPVELCDAYECVAGQLGLQDNIPVTCDIIGGNFAN